MSFARLTNDSEVYVYQDAEGGYTCCFCRLNPHAEQFNVPTAKLMVTHLEEHRAAGHKVPEYALESLREEPDGPAPPFVRPTD